MGFMYVHDQSYTNEIFDFAVELYIREKRRSGDTPFPLISPVCPVVGWLIAHRFPGLLSRIPPLMTPREIVTRESKSRLAEQHGLAEDDIRVLHITPCPAIMVSARESAPAGRPYHDVAVGINHIHEMIKKNIHEIDDDRVLHHSSGVGLAMAMSGGEISGIKSRCLAVSGLHESIRYLEKIEMGLLNEIEYVEFRVCPEGCIGGPFTVSDRYQARLLLQNMFRMFGDEKRIKYAYVKRLYKDGWFLTERQELLEAESTRRSRRQILEGIERINKVEEILRHMPRKECGVCGSPDCRTFAEDVVDGRAEPEDCIFWPEQRRALKIRDDQ
jgi:iron only hydrogenase large subunit-like protein